VVDFNFLPKLLAVCVLLPSCISAIELMLFHLSVTNDVLKVEIPDELTRNSDQTFQFTSGKHPFGQSFQPDVYQSSLYASYR